MRARLGTTNPQPYSAPVAGTTMGHWGPQEFWTAYERDPYRPDPAGPADPYTSTAEEADFTAKLDAASDRMRVVELAAHAAEPAR